jgi:hypothetical protein
LNLDWPVSNDALFEIRLDGVQIWSGEDLDPPTPINSWAGGSGAREVGVSEYLEAYFGTAAAGSGYTLLITFNNGCQAVTGN